MKIVYYRALLKRRGRLTANERIIYSFLLSKSISNEAGLFDNKGEKINDGIEYYISRHGIPLVGMAKERIARELSMSRRGVVNAFAKFARLGIIKQEHTDKILFINKEIYKGGFFELDMNTALKGELLVFYSYLLAKSERHEFGTIDTFTNKLAQEYGTTPNAISQYLKRLKELGWTYRDSRGRIQIKPAI